MKTGAQLGEVPTAGCASLIYMADPDLAFAFSHPCNSRYHASIAITCSNLRCALDQLVSTETSMPDFKRVF